MAASCRQSGPDPALIRPCCRTVPVAGSPMSTAAVSRVCSRQTS